MRDKTGRRSAPVGPSPAVQTTPLRGVTRASHRPCSPVPHPPQRKALACASRALGPCARGSALGARDVPQSSQPRSVPGRLCKGRMQTCPETAAPQLGLTPPHIAQETRRRAQQTIAQHRTRGLQSDWSASQTEKSTQNKGSRTRISGFKKRESPRQEAFSLNVRLMVRLAHLF